MKLNVRLAENLYCIVSEPGDATKYDYIVYKDYDYFCFMPRKSTFRFPQRLSWWDVEDIDDNELIKLAEKECCNPHTLTECIRTMKEIRSDQD